jgi:tRNA nucleotidyltransferase/poly(A) polymerase
MNSQLFHVLKNTVEELSVEAFVIGGFVRDFILKRKQKKRSGYCCFGFRN